MTEKRTIKNILFTIGGIAFAVPSLFFAYYTLRLIYMNVPMEDAAAHRMGGMLIGAIAFPVIAIICGLISWFFIKRGLRK